MTWATVCISLVAVVVASRFLIVAKASNVRVPIFSVLCDRITMATARILVVYPAFGVSSLRFLWLVPLFQPCPSMQVCLGHGCGGLLVSFHNISESRRSISLVYRQLGSDTISIVPLAWGFTSIYTRSAEVTRQVLGGKPQYWKAPESLANFL